MKIKKRNNYYLLIVILLAAVLRLWKLGTIPPHLTPDEAALGYNAYSIFRTGRDEYGQLFPVIFKSFGDYKPGLYVYLAVPFIALFGLNEISVRLPSVIFGAISVWLIYKIADLLLKDKEKSFTFSSKFSVKEIAAFLLAVSPWHIHFSRGAWEVNVALSLTLAGIYFFLKSFRKPKSIIYSSLAFALTLLTYQGAKLSSLVVMFLLAILYWKQVKNIKPRLLVISFVIGLLISCPILFSFFIGRTGRLSVFSILSYPRPKEYLQELLNDGNETVGSISYYLFHSEVFNFARGILGRWFNHFSGRFLFFEGDWQNPRHSAPNYGVLLLVDLLLLPIGLVSLFKEKLSREKTFILLWMILAPLPAILSRDQVHAVRAFNMVIPTTIISSLGFAQLLTYFRKIRNTILHTAYYMLVVFIFIGSIIYFLDAYFVHLPYHNAKYWFYGYKQAVEEITPTQASYKYILFQQSYDQPYIYFLFYQKYDPRSYQQQVKLTNNGIDVGLVDKLDNINFQKFSWPAPAQKGDLVIGNDIVTHGSESDKNFKLLKTVMYPNRMVAFRILEKL